MYKKLTNFSFKLIFLNFETQPPLPPPPQSLNLQQKVKKNYNTQKRGNHP